MKVFTGVQAFYGKYDFSGYGTSFAPDGSFNILESKPFNAAAIRKDKGLYNFSGTLEALLPFGTSAAAFGNDLNTNIGTRVPLSFHLDKLAAAKGDPSMLVNALHNQQIALTQGELRTVSLSLESERMFFGKVLEIGTKTTTGNGGTGIVMPAVGAGQTIGCALHVSDSTGSMTMRVESDDNDSFTSGTIRFVFAGITTGNPTSEFLTLTPSAGITDTFWRATWTSTSTPSHSVSMSLGIL